MGKVRCMVECLVGSPAEKFGNMNELRLMKPGFALILDPQLTFGLQKSSKHPRTSSIGHKIV